jgi:hypothetical protein
VYGHKEDDESSVQDSLYSKNGVRHNRRPCRTKELGTPATEMLINNFGQNAVIRTLV